MLDPEEQEIPPAEIASLLALLPWRERDRAQAILLRNDGASLQLLADIIAQQQQIRHEGSWSAPVLLVLCLLLAALCNLDMWPWIVPGGSLCLLLLATRIYRPTRVEKAALKILWHSRSEQSIGPLLECLSRQTRVPRAETRRRLLQLLPLLTPEVFRTFTRKQKNSLYALLNYAQRDLDLDLRLAVLAALKRAGDRTCLGHLMLLALGGATSYTARTVREAAIHCLDHLTAHLDFGPLEWLPKHINTAYAQLTTEKPDMPLYFTSLLTVRQLLPQLSHANYQEVVPEENRRQLYSMSMLLGRRFKGQVRNPHQQEIQREIVQTGERLGDVCAVPSFRFYVQNVPKRAVDDLYTAVRQALRTLEPLLEREKLSKTLLRGAPAPGASPDELLRAAFPQASATDPAELLRASATQIWKPAPLSEAQEQTTLLHTGTESES